MGRMVADEGSDKAVLEGAGVYFLSVVEASQDCIRVISADGAVEYMNAQGKALFEIDDFDGRNRRRYWPDLWPPESRDTVEQALRTAQSGNDAGLREPIAQAVSGCLRELFGVHGLTEQADFSIADHALGKRRG